MGVFNYGDEFKILVTFQTTKNRPQKQKLSQIRYGPIFNIETLFCHLGAPLPNRSHGRTLPQDANKSFLQIISVLVPPSSKYHLK